MSKKLKLKEIAENLGVSTATVSRVINNKPDVGKKTRQKILAALQDNDYDISERDPEEVDLSLPIIGVVNQSNLYPIVDDYISQIVRGANDRAISHSLSIMLLDYNMVQAAMHNSEKYPFIKRLSGIIWSQPVFNISHKNFMDRLGLPYVVINNKDHGVKAPFIESDNLTASRQAVESLIGMGHRKIGFIGGNMALSNIDDRYHGYLQHMKEFGLEVNNDWIINDLSQLSTTCGLEGTYRLLGRNNPPSAIISASMSITRGVYKAIKMKGLTIPDDISILSFDEPRKEESLTPSVTTFRQPLQQMGSDGVDLIIEQLHNPVREEDFPHLIAPLSLILRDSIKVLEN